MTMRTISTLLLIFMITLLVRPNNATAQTVSQGWVARYGPTTQLSRVPSGMVADASGNIYITGTLTPSYQNNQIETIKYGAGGGTQWSATYAGSPAHMDQACGVGVDGAGNVYAAGTSYYNFPTGQGGAFLVVKYSPSGVVLWADTAYANYGATANAMKVDAAGNVYVTGYTYYDDPKYDNAYNYDYFTVKFNTAGAVQWRASYNGTADDEDYADAIQVDASGNVYITGWSPGQISRRLGLFGGETGTITLSTGNDFVTIKYSSTGVAQWTQRYNDASNGNDMPTGLVVDNSGNVYVTGQSGSVGETVCYSSAGAQQWAYTENNASMWTGIALAPSGNIVVAGAGVSSDGSTVNWLTEEYAPAGTLAWSDSYFGGTNPLAANMSAASVAVDARDNVYITAPVGSDPFNPPATLYDYAVIAYSSSGAQDWVMTYNGPASLGDWPSSIAVVNPSSPTVFSYASVYVTGLTDDPYTNVGDPSWTTIQYTQAERWIINPLATQSNSLTGTGLKTELEPNLANYPNPFHGTTSIAYTLPNDSHIILQVFDAGGKSIATLLNDDEPAGQHILSFSSGRLASGIYEYRIVATSPQGNYAATKQMIIQ
jgi:sugar lactone lactonase YvrE